MDSLSFMQSIKIKTHPVTLGPVTNIEENINILIITKYSMSINIQ